jgi:hypothetical protein
MFPEVIACRGESEDNRQQLASCLQAAWDIIPTEFFDALYQSILVRIKAYIAANR